MNTAGAAGPTGAGRFRTSKVAFIDPQRSHRRVRRRRRIVFVSAGPILIVCVALVLPAFAFASRSARTVVVRKLSSGAVTATCPKGEHVSFGGVIAEFKPPPGAKNRPLVFAEGMRRTAADRWTVSGQSGAKGVGSHLTSIAYCDRGGVPTSVSKKVGLAANQVGSATATCPAGQVVVGGGFNSGAAPGHLELIVRLARVTSTQWQVTLRNIAPTATSVTAIAYCGHGPAPIVQVSAVGMASNKGGTARASCPPNTSLVFGGLIALSPNSADLEAFSWTAASTRQWAVGGFNGGHSMGTMEALAYCR